MRSAASFAMWLLLGCALLVCSCAKEKPRARLIAPQTTAFAREKARQELLELKIEPVMRETPATVADSIWEGACWAIGFTRHTSRGTEEGLRHALKEFDKHSLSFPRATLEAAYTTYPRIYAAEVQRIAESTANEKLFAMACLYLVRGGDIQERSSCTRLLHRRFQNFSSHPILFMLDHTLRTQEFTTTPPIVDLMIFPVREKAVVLISVQRHTRKFPGRTVVRTSDGTFVRNADGSVFNIPHLALSASDLPGYITNGNTPQGVLSFQEFGISENLYIGPTENLQLVLPFEVNAAKFFHRRVWADTVWTDQLYSDLLPPSWRAYTPMYEAFYAGKAGRTEILAHGTTIDPSYYQGEPFYPNAPTQGCLSASETWSAESGENTASDQLRLVDVLKRLGANQGFVVVVEVDDTPKPVSEQEVTELVRLAEQKHRGAAANR